MIQLFCIVFVGIATYFFVRLELFNNDGAKPLAANNIDEDEGSSSTSSSSSTVLLPQPPIDLSSKCSLMTLDR